MRHRSIAFTLIELLVVISIIALLIAILLPSLARAKERSQQISCASKLKQINLGFVTYVEDNRQIYPPRYCTTNTAPSYVPFYDPNTTWNGWYWHHLTNMAVLQNRTEAAKDNQSLYRCPSQDLAPLDPVTAKPPPNTPGYFWSGSVNQLSYGYNYLGSGDSGYTYSGLNRVKSMEIAQPSKTILSGDSMTREAMYHRTGGALDYAIGDRHSGQPNVLWVDGHATLEKKDVVESTRAWWTRQAD